MNEVTCASCGSAAAAGQRFCGSCGAALAGMCPSCGASNPSDHRFCGTCGTKLDGASPTSSSAPPDGGTKAGARGGGSSGPGTGPSGGPGGGPGGSGSSPVAERRLVTVLFADLVGFTAFAEDRDSEDVRETLTRYFDLATNVLTRYGGTVEKFIGDAVMAVWGTPTAHEDDAERAVRAALELVDAVKDLGPSIEARAGVLTGETAVTLGASNQGMVAGDLVNTAARLQSVAAPSTVLVGESTHRAASVAIAFEPAGEQSLKGKASPVPAWRAIRVIAERGGRGRAETLEAPFVGRDVELRLLKDLYHGAGAERRVRHVSVVGTAGIGKSRLAWELEKYLDGIQETVRWHQGRSPAYGQGITFWSLGEMIRSRAGLAETDDEGMTRQKVAAVLDEFMPTHPNRKWVESALLELLGVSSGFPSQELFGAWRAFFEALAADSTVVLVFQDVHWADTGTLDFIDHLVEWSRSAPIFILSLARPEILDSRPEWGSARRGFTSVYLEPLSEAAMRDLLAGLVPGLPESTVKAVVSQAEGVPLYAVETVRMLVTAGQLKPEADGTYSLSGDVSTLAVPETLTALIAARLDALDPVDRAILLDAAVLGQSFTPAGVSAVAGRSVEELEPRLKSLVRREMLRHVADERSPERGQYAFVQALVREVAYNTLARRDRQVRHLAAARWFESLGEQELVGALAGHYLSAQSLAAAGAEADALGAQARIALKAAGDRAASLGSHRQAVAFYEQALSVTTDDADEADIHARAGASAAVAGDFETGDRHYTRALEIQRARGNRSAAARLTGALGQMLLTGRRVERGNQLLAEGAREFADLGDDPALLAIASQQARGLFLANDHKGAIQISEQVLERAEPLDELQIIADTLVTRGSALVTVLRWREGIAALDGGRKLAETHGFNNTILRAINNSLGLRLLFDPQATYRATLEGLALARRLGQSGWVSGMSGIMAFGAHRTGDWDAAIDEVEAALADFTDPQGRAIMVNNLANLRAVKGLPTADLIAELEATSALVKSDTSTSWVLESRGWVALGSGDLEAATETWLKSVELDPVGSSNLIAWLARLAIWGGDADAAEGHTASFWEHSPHGGACEVDRDILRAGIAGLRGDPRGATTAYRAAIPKLQELQLPLDEALLAIDLAYVLGPADPLTIETASRARALFTRIGARPYMDQLDAAIAHGPHAAPPASAQAGDSNGTDAPKRRPLASRPAG